MRGWLLDTNVVSELARPKPNAQVLDWLRGLPPDRRNVAAIDVRSSFVIPAKRLRAFPSLDWHVPDPIPWRAR